MKKMFSVALAAAMAMSMAIPAFAADDDSTTEITNGGKLELKGELADMTIKVTLPDSSSVILNPYQIEIDEDGEEGDGSNMTQAQIYTPNYAIVSESNVALSVDVVAVATAPSKDVTLASKSLKGDTKTTTKSAFMYLEMTAGTTEAPLTVEESATVVAADQITWATAYDSKATNQLLLTGNSKGDTKTGMVTVPAATFNGDDVEAEGVAAFRITGDAVSAPAKAWTSADAIPVVLTFTFNPIANAIVSE